MKIFISFVCKGKFDWAILNVEGVETEQDIVDITNRLQNELKKDGLTIINWKKL